MRLGQFLTVTLLILNLISPILNVSCSSSNYCMACNLSTADSCDECFNWGSGTISARSRNTSNTPPDCQTKLTLLTDDCKYYAGNILSTTTSRTYDSCQICNKDFLRWTASDSTLKC